MLIDPVVVDENSGGADIGARSDCGIADVGEVWNLGALTDGGVLHLNVSANFGPRSEGGSRADKGEGTDERLRADRGVGNSRLDDAGTRSDNNALQGSAGTDDGAALNFCCTAKCRAWVDRDITCNLNSEVDPSRKWIDDANSSCLLYTSPSPRD